MNSHLKGILITALGVLIVTPDSLFVRLIDGDPLVTGFWRGLIAGLVVFIAVLLFQGPRAFSVVFRSGKPGLIYMVLVASTAPAFALAVTNTSVANVVFILAATPIFAAIYSRIFLGEPIERRMVLTLIVVVIGLGVITIGSSESEIASWKGDLWAVYIAAAFAAALTAVRKIKDVSMVPAVPFAYIGAALVLLLFTSPFEAFAANWLLYLGHGVMIGAASCLLTLGPRYITSAEVSLLVLLESVLAPILVWWVLGEDPGPLAIAGGAMVIVALLVSNYFAVRATRV
ncbi:MAG: DMT family transporter [Paracoccaceae bacterium]|nr:DMT family transporter [Paracoccaceae bacterium]MDG1371035.1 DMT family transporter [Paracoccaceae bacterium]